MPGMHKFYLMVVLVGARWYKSSRLSYRGTLWLPQDEAAAFALYWMH